MPTTTISLPSDFSANVVGYAGSQLAAFAPYVATIIGVLLALVAIDFLIKSFHK